MPNGSGGAYMRADYFAAYGGDGLNGIGTKASMVGWLLSVAAKSNLGPYAQAANAYLLDLAPDGQAQFGVDLLAAYAPGGDYASGGRLDPGLPGAALNITHDQSVLVVRGNGSLDLFETQPAFATNGNDTIVSTTGLDAGESRFLYDIAPIQLGFGNDTLTVTGGLASRTIDAGPGNDRLNFSAFNGGLTLGAGYDTVTITALTSVYVDNYGAGGSARPPEITDFIRGQDTLVFADTFGPGRISVFDVRAAATLDAALVTIAANTAANANTVFEYGGSTYVFHQNADPAANIGAAIGNDGLLKLVGVTGVTLDARDGRAYDIHFGS